jgi:hypothetical protein
MRLATLLILTIIGSLFTTGCGSNVPAEAEIRAMITGAYCSDDYRLVLTDSTYRSTKYRKGIVSSAFNIESCKGGYELALEEGKWVIHYVKDGNPRGIANCKQTYTLWTPTEGFLIGEESIQMKEPIDNTSLVKGSCSE